jgi:hypothetical protein
MNNTKPRENTAARLASHPDAELTASLIRDMVLSSYRGSPLTSTEKSPIAKEHAVVTHNVRGAGFERANIRGRKFSGGCRPDGKVLFADKAQH